MNKVVSFVQFGQQCVILQSGYIFTPCRLYSISVLTAEEELQMLLQCYCGGRYVYIIIVEVVIYHKNTVSSIDAIHLGQVYNPD